MKLNVIRFGSACGIATGVFYIGCVFLMSTVGHDGLVKFLNGLLHGLDVGSILRPHVGLGESGLGLINSVVVSWLFGALLATVYNFGAGRTTNGGKP
jgi:hypothetical protein